MFTVHDQNKISEFLQYIQELQIDRWNPDKFDISEKKQILSELQTLVYLEDALIKFMEEHRFKEEVIETLPQIKNREIFEENVIIGLFKRDLDGPTMGLWGGYVHSTNEDIEPIWVPEMLVRKVNMQDGAIIKAIPNRTMEEESIRYYYELLREGNDEKVGRIERQGYCISIEGKHYAVDIETNEKYPILEKDIDHYSVEIEQPIIFALSTVKKDISVRIVEALEYNKMTNSSNGKNSSQVKRINPLTMTTDKNEYPKILNGEKILIISADYGTDNYKRVVESMGGVFEHGAVDKLGKLSGQASSADGVILVWQSSNHAAVENIVKPLCKEKGIPFEYAESTATRAIKEAIERLNNRMRITM